jgi:uncharacterized membrane protein YhaH (DUF805 family)
VIWANHHGWGGRGIGVNRLILMDASGWWLLLAGIGVCLALVLLVEHIKGD